LAAIGWRGEVETNRRGAEPLSQPPLGAGVDGFEEVVGMDDVEEAARSLSFMRGVKPLPRPTLT